MPLRKYVYKQRPVSSRTPEQLRQTEQNRTITPERIAKSRVKSITRAAIKSGRLVRLPCEVCSAFPSEAHHEDYSKPLDVTWLCRKHHAEKHRHARGNYAKNEECRGALMSRPLLLATLLALTPARGAA